MEPNTNPTPPNLTPPAPPAPPTPVPPAGPGPAAVPPSGPTPPGVVVGATDPMSGALPPQTTPASGSGRRWLKPLLIALVAVLVIGGGAAAAYFAIVVPNQPQNVLKKAVANTLAQTQEEATATINDSAQGFKFGIKTASNTSAKAADLQLTVTAEGITFPIEGRLVNHNIYVKVGDLSTIASLLNAYSPEAGTLAQTISGQLSNKWIVFDSTLIDQSAPLNCILNSSWTYNNADIQLLQNQYSAHQFATIQSTADATVNGASAEKFNLSIDNAALDKYISSLNNLSIVKSFSKCAGSSMGTSSLSGFKGDTGHTALTVWVDKSTKRIVQIANTTNGVSTNATLAYKPANITAPTGSEPALQVLSNLQSSLSSSGVNLSQLFGGASSTSSGSTTL